MSKPKFNDDIKYEELEQKIIEPIFYNDPINVNYVLVGAKYNYYITITSKENDIGEVK